MITANAGLDNYAAFKSAFDALGGNQKTQVVVGAGLLLASIEGVILEMNFTTLLPSFATDFPQAVTVVGAGTGG
jgi:hypothetical protein